MFKRILVPVDGSERSDHAAQTAVDLARQLHATVVGLYVYPAFQIVVTDEMYVPPDLANASAYRESQLETAKTRLATLQRLAKQAGVSCQGLASENNSPAQAIVDAAQPGNGECDLIVMAAHGRGEFMQALMGSVTTQVLSLCSIPVMVCREPPEEKLEAAEMPVGQMMRAPGNAAAQEPVTAAV
jgi:nucleotide-binding universal stress UspA family protein